VRKAKRDRILATVRNTGEQMKPMQMWALMNFGRLMCVHYRRKHCKEAGIEMLIGGEADFRKMIRSGAFTIEKVEVRTVDRTAQK
jgi:hypothetical protein